MPFISGDVAGFFRRAQPFLKSPVLRSFLARRTPAVEVLPDAGESALAHRSMLVPSAVLHTAVSRWKLSTLDFEEVYEGELDSHDVAWVEVWSYDPCVADQEKIDDVSLALSLRETADEGVLQELNSLMREEAPF